MCNFKNGAKSHRETRAKNNNNKKNNRNVIRWKGGGGCRPSIKLVASIASSGLETLLYSCTVYLPLLPPPRLLAAEWFLHKQAIVLHFRVTHVKVCTNGRATRMVGGALVGHGSVSQLVQMQKEQLAKHSESVQREPHLHKV